MECNFSKPTLELILCNDDRNLLESFVHKTESPMLYSHLTQNNKLQFKKEIQDTLDKSFQEKLINLQNQKKNESEEDDFQIDVKISELYAESFDLKNFLKTNQMIRKTNLSSSLAMDIFLCQIRMAIIFQDKKLLMTSINEGKGLMITGCDWDRRNKFKAYEGLYSLITKDYVTAGNLIFESLPVYECKELISYEKLVLYALFSYLMSFDREDLKKIISSSDVLETLKDNEKIIRLVECFYHCDYNNFFECLISSIDLLKEDYFLKSRVNFFIRELKIRIYSQLLLSYKSLSLEMLSNLLKVSCEYIEKDLCEFIVDERIKCKIDRLSGVVFVNENKESKEKLFVEKGDFLMQMIKKNIK
ncbi:proteasome regulatory particle subunit [Gurleya vavrai]